MAASLKTVKSPYIRNRLTDFAEIWHGEAHWPTDKISNFSKTEMAAAAIVKITKIAISPQRFDRSLRNLASLCKMGLLTLKKIKFPKSKMADGRPYEKTVK